MASQPDFADLVSAVWENRVRDQKLMLVLTGSAVSVMEQMPGAQGGLHRRAALEPRLDLFAVREARAFLPDIPAADFLAAHAVCGGYPLHLDQWDQSSDVEANLRQLAYEPAEIPVRDAMDIIGAAVRQRTAARLDQHLGRVFEGACRAHATLLVRDSEPPSDIGTPAAVMPSN